MVVAALFLLFGLVLGGAVWSDTSDAEPGLTIALGGFLVIWVVACSAIIVSLWRVQAAGKGARGDSLFELQGQGPDGELGPGRDLDTRLRKLEGLRRDGLLSEQEYQDQRQRALRDG
jgi:hypothetical protein